MINLSLWLGLVSFSLVSYFYKKTCGWEQWVDIFIYRPKWVKMIYLYIDQTGSRRKQHKAHFLGNCTLAHLLKSGTNITFQSCKSISPEKIWFELKCWTQRITFFVTCIFCCSESNLRKLALEDRNRPVSALGLLQGSYLISHLWW